MDRIKGPCLTRQGNDKKIHNYPNETPYNTPLKIGSYEKSFMGGNNRKKTRVKANAIIII
jgi:hypothetical protein